MATSGKKGKKSKGKPVPLQDFLATNTGTGTPAVPQGQKKVTSWAEDNDEEYERRTISLPTAPRASRMLTDESIPQNPPYLAYVSNLPYDVSENDIHEFFVNLRIESIRLPREDGDSGRLRGFGYIEFHSRDDLIDAVRIADPFIRSRRIRIDISNENDQKRMTGGNWRTRGGNDNFKERDPESRRGFSFRDRRERDGEGSEESGNWRSGDRPRDQSPPPRQEQRRGGFGERENFKRRGYDERSKDEEVQERPKLNLIPRTLPIKNLPPPSDEKEPEVVSVIKSEPVPAANIFGSAKPVDTSAKEREIEDRLEKLEQERHAKKKEEKELKEIIEIPVEEKKVEIISWRKPADEKEEETTKSIQTKERKYSPNRKDSTLRRRDERVGMRDNRDKDYRDRDSKTRDSRDKNQKDYRYLNKDNDRNSREAKDNNELRNRNEANRQDKTKEDSREPEDRMPKYLPPQGPNLSMSNKYAAFLDEDVSD